MAFNTDFYRTHKCSILLYGDKLRRISHRWVKNCVKYGYEILTSFLFRRFHKILKASIKFLISVRPSVRMEQFDPNRGILMKFYEYFSKICPENSSFIKI